MDRKKLINLLIESGGNDDKDKKFSSPFPVFYEKIKQSSNKKVISFCLFGVKPIYYLGAEKNIEQAKKIYPDYICRFYCTQDVPNLNRLKELAENGECELILPNLKTPPVFWRILACADPNIDICLQRDCDSIVNHREKAAVDEWLESGKTLHFMHDCPSGHFHKIMAGMWGIKKTDKFNFSKELDIFFKSKKYKDVDPSSVSNDWGSGTASYFDDQHFLSNILYKTFEDDYIEHGEENPFPKHQPIEHGSFVGDRVFATDILTREDMNDKENLYITSHLAIHDQMPLNGMVRHFCENKKRVVFAVRESNFKLINYCLSDLKNLEIEILKGMDDPMQIYMKKYKEDNFGLLALGLYGKKIHSNSSFIDQCYEQANLDKSIRVEKFFLPNDAAPNFLSEEHVKDFEFYKSQYNTPSNSNFFEKVYCINLNERKDRWDYAQKNIKPIFPNLERFPAVSLHPDLLEYIPIVEPTYFRPYIGDTLTLSSGEYGCSLSSFLVWKKMIKESINSCLIVEDDASFKDNALNKIKDSWKVLPEDWDVVLLSSYGSGPEINNYFSRFNGAWFTSTVACAWSLNGAKKMVDIVSSNKIKGPLDSFIGDNKDKINIYFYKEPVCTQTNSPISISNIHHAAGNNGGFQNLWSK